MAKVSPCRGARACTDESWGALTGELIKRGVLEEIDVDDVEVRERPTSGLSFKEHLLYYDTDIPAPTTSLFLPFHHLAAEPPAQRRVILAGSPHNRTRGQHTARHGEHGCGGLE